MRTTVEKKRRKAKPESGDENWRARQPRRYNPHSNVLAFQRSAGNQAASEILTGYCAKTSPVKNDVGLDKRFHESQGNPLDQATRGELEARFKAEFTEVRVHTDAEAAVRAEELNADAFTTGSDIHFAPGKYNPETPDGKQLLAHELGHVVQQSHAGLSGGSHALESEADQASTAVGRGESASISLAASNGAPQLQPRGKKNPSPSSPERRPQTEGRVQPSQQQPTEAETTRELRATKFHRVRMHFDGRDLIVFGDEKEILRFSGNSGRPVRLSEEHAALCGADVVTDSYMNDARFVGIENFGPIPEGTYRFAPPSIQRFGFGQQLRLLTAGIGGSHTKVNIEGTTVSAGDWGSGRVALHPVGGLKEGPCGNANARSEFFLHGGILAGSSGCIDIGGDFGDLADFLAGFSKNITLSVAYEHRPSSVGFFTGLGGAIGYGRFSLGHGPRLRLGAEFAPAGVRAVGSLGYDAVLQWAGGALRAGVRLDVPVRLDDPQAFVRAGLSSEANFRIMRALYGQVVLGYSWDVIGPERSSGLEIGAGVKYDFGPFQLEALYNVLRPMAKENRVHQALVGMGFTF